MSDAVGVAATGFRLIRTFFEQCMNLGQRFSAGAENRAVENKAVSLQFCTSRDSDIPAIQSKYFVYTLHKFVCTTREPVLWL